MKKKVVVIGGGPGGYVAAIRLAQLGEDVALVNRDELGGVCLNWGCIPSKALIHAAKKYEEQKNLSEIGIEVGTPKLDFKKTQEWKRGVVSKLTGGIGQLLKANRVEHIQAEASFESSNRLLLKHEDGETKALDFEQAILATGSRTIEIPGFKIDGESVVDSKEALGWEEIPKRMLVIGGGVIGLEIGMLYRKFGTEVSVVEMLPQLLPGTDKEIADTIRRSCKKKKMDLYLQSKASGYKKTKSGLKVSLETPKGKKEIEVDVILLSVGRRPNTENLGLDRAGIHLDDTGFVSVNAQMETTQSGIYAIGDVSGPPLLAHKASKEGMIAAACIAGQAEAFDVQAMPGAIFTDPEVASVGMTEDEARKQGYSTVIGKFPFGASGRALSTRQTDGFVKIISEEKSERILGVHIIGPSASDLISEAVLAMEMGATVDDLALTVHPHPTLSESIMEAAEAALGKAIHMVNPKPKGKKEKAKENELR